MESMPNVVALFERFLPFLATLAVASALLMIANRVMKRRWGEVPASAFRFQLTMLSLTLVAALAVILALPISDSLRGQLLSLIGILLSAAIALSSTTFIGNMMAGIMLRAIKSARPGDFVTLGELTGRITEVGLLHCEIQTEFRDLVTIPNLNMVTQPVKVVRASGTIITAEVALGYDVPHGRVAKLLCAAAENAGLIDTFVHVRELGDFAVTYRVAGLLKDAQSLISARSQLRVAVLDALHEANVEIVSPTFMNTRAQPEGSRFVPPVLTQAAETEQTRVEDVAFDKAEQAASLEELRKTIEEADKRIEAAKKNKDEAKKAGDGKAPPDAELEQLESYRARLLEQLAEAEEKRHEEK
ncbi:MAG TPA: mechanosensitive ion channel domain-containing protein [Gammaproteobacteria bacterium]|nr:mechanosensitive ion channel domain-containing protein [Gammaproteobacteria bacterium]